MADQAGPPEAAGVAGREGYSRPTASLVRPLTVPAAKPFHATVLGGSSNGGRSMGEAEVWVDIGRRAGTSDGWEGRD